MEIFLSHQSLDLDPEFRIHQKALDPDLDSMNMDPDLDSMNMDPKHCANYFNMSAVRTVQS